MYNIYFIYTYIGKYIYTDIQVHLYMYITFIYIHTHIYIYIFLSGTENSRVEGWYCPPLPGSIPPWSTIHFFWNIPGTTSLVEEAKSIGHWYQKPGLGIACFFPLSIITRKYYKSFSWCLPSLGKWKGGESSLLKQSELCLGHSRCSVNISYNYSQALHSSKKWEMGQGSRGKGCEDGMMVVQLALSEVTRL